MGGVRINQGQEENGGDESNSIKHPDQCLAQYRTQQMLVLSLLCVSFPSDTGVATQPLNTSPKAISPGNG